MTYEELLAMAKEGDPLVDLDHLERATVTPEGLLILGTLKDGYTSDMLIRIEPDGLRAWMRDPEGASGEDVFHGPTWTAEYLAPDYDALVTWAYSW